MKIILLFLNIIFFSLESNLLLAQITTNDNGVGKNYIIKSDILSSGRQIQIFS